jgi:hypothetical protein
MAGLSCLLIALAPAKFARNETQRLKAMAKSWRAMLPPIQNSSANREFGNSVG